DHDVGDHAHLGVRLHDHAGQPADHSPDDQGDEKPHGRPPRVLWVASGGVILPALGPGARIFRLRFLAILPGTPMKLLYSYLRRYWGLVVLALVLAATNQIFSLLDPLIFRYVIDRYATRFSEYTTGQFFRGVSLLLLAAVGVAFVSRVAKNFQDYCINVI